MFHERRPIKRLLGNLFTVAFAVALACATGCSGGSSPPSASGLPMTLTSDAGTLHVELSASTPPVVGSNTVELTVTASSSGAPQNGLSITVVPWMPSMDHGTSSPTVTPEGDGRYKVSELYFFMPGTWILKTSFAGPVTDHAEPAFEIQ